MNFIIGVIVFIIILNLSVAIHEFGHLIPAKLFKVVTPRYFIGMGKKIFSFKKGETEYGLAMLPIGGFTDIVGMYPPYASGLAKKRIEQGKTSGPFYKMSQEARDLMQEEVEKYGKNRVFYTLKPWKKIVILALGPITNLILAIIMMSIALSGFGSSGPSTTIGSVEKCLIDCNKQNPPDSPAQKAGLKAGDTVYKVNNTQINSWDEFKQAVQESNGNSIKIFYKDSSGTQKSTNLKPEVQTAIDSNGTEQKAYFVGVTTAMVQQKLPVTELPRVITNQIVANTKMYISLPQKIVQGVQFAFKKNDRPADSLVSVVGIGKIFGQVGSSDNTQVSSAMNWLDKLSSWFLLGGSLNLALCLFNFIPLLPLDGGRIVGALWESLKNLVAKVAKRKKPLPADMSRLVPLSNAVFGILILLSVVLVWADIFNPIKF